MRIVIQFPSRNRNYFENYVISPDFPLLCPRQFFIVPVPTILSRNICIFKNILVAEMNYFLHFLLQAIFKYSVYICKDIFSLFRNFQASIFIFVKLNEHDWLMDRMATKDIDLNRPKCKIYISKSRDTYEWRMVKRKRRNWFEYPKFPTNIRETFKATINIAMGRSLFIRRLFQEKKNI